MITYSLFTVACKSYPIEYQKSMCMLINALKDWRFPDKEYKCDTIIISNLSNDNSKASSKRFLHIVRSTASSFDWQYPLLSLRSSSSFLRLLPHLLFTSICPFIFPWITCCRRQFLRKMWPIQLAFRFLISCRIFLCSLTLSNTSSFLTWSIQLIFSILLQHHISKLSRRFCTATFDNRDKK